MSAKQSWFHFKNLTADTVDLCIDQEIGFWGVTAKDFLAELKAVSGKAIRLSICSPGGDIIQGNVIYTALTRHVGGVSVQIDGIAASMASVIAMAGDPVCMAENAFLMIHNPSAYAEGESKDLRSMAETMDKMRDGLVAIYCAKSGKTAEEVSAAMDESTWFTAQEALDFGLIDEITDRVEIAAAFDLSKLPGVPHTLTSVDKANLDMSTNISLKEHEEKLGAVQDQATKNFSDFQNALTESNSLKAKLAEAEAQVTAKVSELAISAKALADKDAELVAVKAQLGVDVAKINAEAARIIAASGHAPVAMGVPKKPLETMTMEKFNAMTPSDRMAFVKAGGKLSDK